MGAIRGGRGGFHKVGAATDTKTTQKKGKHTAKVIGQQALSEGIAWETTNEFKNEVMDCLDLQTRGGHDSICLITHLWLLRPSTDYAPTKLTGSLVGSLPSYGLSSLLRG